MSDRNCQCLSKNELGISTVFQQSTHDSSFVTDCDELSNNFDNDHFEKEHQIIDNMAVNIESLYDEIFNGSQESLLTLPSTFFQYGKKDDQAKRYCRIINE